MPTNPILDIIPRNIENEEVTTALRQFSSTVDEIVNFGSHILKWCLDAATGGDENLPLFLSLRHILELIDSISINIRESSVFPCKLLLRGVLESYFGATYMLEDKSKTKKRAMAFMICYVNRRLNIYKKLIPSTDANKNFIKKIEDDRLVGKAKIGNPPKILNSLIANLDGLLKKPSYKRANDEFQRFKKSGRRDPYWYSLYDGPKNLEELANHLKLSGLYHVLYRHWSEAVHGTDIIEGKIFRDISGQGGIIQLRLPGDAQVITSLTLSIACDLFKLYVQYFVPETLPDYTTWYMQEIRDINLRLIGSPIIQVKTI